MSPSDPCKPASNFQEGSQLEQNHNLDLQAMLSYLVLSSWSTDVFKVGVFLCGERKEKDGKESNSVNTILLK